MQTKHNSADLESTCEILARVGRDKGLLDIELDRLINVLTKAKFMDTKALRRIAAALMPRANILDETVIRILGSLGAGRGRALKQVQVKRLRDFGTLC